MPSRPRPTAPLCPRQLAEQHLPMVRHVASALLAKAHPYMERDDLISIGTLALLSAASRFDPTLGTTFASFAYLRVRGAMLESIGQFGPHSRGAVRRRSGRSEQKRIPPSRRCFDDNLHHPSEGRDAKAAIASAIDDQRLAQAVARAIAELDQRERTIIARHYFAEDSLLSVGEDLGMSKSWTSRLHARTLRQLRERAEQLLTGAPTNPDNHESDARQAVA